MSDNKMLIDATHPEETRVVVQRSGRVEEFDFESAARKLLRGNIYLAKVTRVEPSLQAAFVDYGGNRHGFLAFNEIHPDYYQIPVADRLALIEEEAAADAEEEAAAEARAEALARKRTQRNGRRRGGSGRGSRAKATAEDKTGEGADDEREAAGEGEDREATVNEQLDTATATDVNDATPETSPDGEVADNNDVDEDAAVSREENEKPATIAAAVAAEDLVSQAVEADEVEIEADADADTDATEAAADVDDEDDRPDAIDEDIDDGEIEADSLEADSADKPDETGDTAEAASTANGDADGESEAEAVEEVGTEDALEELPSRPRRSRRSYKIQEVIKRRQVILVQVVKEERGNKGAALTTYLSLAGRYTVLMPNTARGGGISRKITQPQDRKRLKAIAADLDVPEGMGLIIRTAGAARTKQEIRRDFEYLLRLWESVRDLTLESNAPSLVYEEGNLIKRSIRDLYNKDVDEVVVAGDESYRDAKDFMKMLMPSHARNVTHYDGPEPLFTRYQIERQLNAMFLPQVTLRSGGYLVINQTEALVAVDVNSGKSTREFSIEETALNTNLEAADEIARQLKLRDLAGLIVIDFIDMEEKRNNRAVERRLKEALRHDRARIQVGRISHFGLLEMSRQRLRTGVLEGSTSQCPHCMGTGIIRSTESVALAVLRGLEDAVMAGASTPLKAVTTPTVALYILNNKRNYINDMEARHGLPISVEGSEEQQGANFVIERGAGIADVRPTPRRTGRGAVKMEWGFEGEDGETSARADATQGASGSDEENRSRRRRRRRGGRRDDRSEAASAQRPEQDALEADNDAAIEPTETAENREAGGEEEKSARRGRRRGRRGGRRTRERRSARANGTETEANGDTNEPDSAQPPGMGPQPSLGEPDAVTASVASDETEIANPASDGNGEATTQSLPEDAAPAKSTPTRRRTAAKKTEAEDETSETGKSAGQKLDPARTDPVADKPRVARVRVTPDDSATETETPAPATTSNQPARKGWWQRRFGTE